MTWGQELLRAFLLTFGVTEIITNLNYLVKKNGLDLARKQHGELPKNILDKKIKVKVVCMLFFGIAFFASSLLCFILHQYLYYNILITAILFSLYGIIEAMYYKYWKTIGFALVTIVVAICTMLV